MAYEKSLRPFASTVGDEYARVLYSCVRPKASCTTYCTPERPFVTGRLAISKGPGGSGSRRTNRPLTYTSSIDGVRTAPAMRGSGVRTKYGSSAKLRDTEAPPSSKLPPRVPVEANVSPTTHLRIDGGSSIVKLVSPRKNPVGVCESPV